MSSKGSKQLKVYKIGRAFRFFFLIWSFNKFIEPGSRLRENYANSKKSKVDEHPFSFNYILFERKAHALCLHSLNVYIKRILNFDS